MSGTPRQQVVILGSTGSIGRSTLDVIAALPNRFTVLGLAAARNSEALQEQIDLFGPRYAALTLDSGTLSGTTVIDTPDALTELATHPDADIIVVATTGHAAIVPTIRALEAGKIVALANKETIVAAGEIVIAIARNAPGQLRPVDSEHSALWQCLGTERADLRQISRLVLTASGGPFRGRSRDELDTVTTADALKHPNWTMGAKVTIDSATLMNKGLEMIEAKWLFDCPMEQIEVVIHPQSLVHSVVEYIDGSILAQIASHDMRLPIQYALTYPDRVAGPAKMLRATDLTRLDFEPPDHDTFPLLNIAREAGIRGSTYPAVLSAADSVAVDAFLGGRLTFHGISDVVRSVLDAHVAPQGPLTLEAVADAESWAEQVATEWIDRRSGPS